MNLSPVHLCWRERTCREGRREMIANALVIRRSSIDTELSQFDLALLALSVEETAHLGIACGSKQPLDYFWS